jgi:hypoxanthine phosphoribosyltransferase
MSSSGAVRLTKDFKMPIEDRPVILVEDIVDTGLTVTKIIKMLRDHGPESIKVCALIDKLERRNMDIVIDYCGFQVKEGFLIGYGLDYDEQYRYLPDIYTIR